MTRIPPDPQQLRDQAKELKVALQAGEQSAVDRLLAFHPKFADRPPERIEDRHFTLRDAQAMIAGEHGFDSWANLLREVEGTPRWDARQSFDIMKRSFAEAEALHHVWISDYHFFLAILDPPKPTPASEVLAELGVNKAEQQERIADGFVAAARMAQDPLPCSNLRSVGHRESQSVWEHRNSQTNMC